MGETLGPDANLSELITYDPEPKSQAIDVQMLTELFEWRCRVFGPGPRTEQHVGHIRLELREIEEDPTSLEEWVDVLLIAFGGAMGTGATPAEVIEAVKAKMAKNIARQWPDYRDQKPGEILQHDRSAE